MFELNLFRFNHKLRVRVCVRLLMSVYKKGGMLGAQKLCSDVHVPTFQRLCFRFFFLFFNESVLLPDTILKVMIYAFCIILGAFYGSIL